MRREPLLEPSHQRKASSKLLRGKLFLDEIGELTVNLQAKLLKIVEEKNVTRAGGNRSRPVDVRIVYATHRDPAVFREDVRYRVTAHGRSLEAASRTGRTNRSVSAGVSTKLQLAIGKECSSQ